MGGEAGSQKAQSEIKLNELDGIGGSTVIDGVAVTGSHAGDKIYETTRHNF